MILGHFFCIWLVSGSLTVDKPNYTLDLNISGCDNNTFKYHNFNGKLRGNYTHASEEIITSTYVLILMQIRHMPLLIYLLFNSNGLLHYIYSITFMYYAVIGFIITVITGTLISLCTGSNKNDSFDTKLLHPFIRRIVIFLQNRKRAEK